MNKINGSEFRLQTSCPNAKELWWNYLSGRVKDPEWLNGYNEMCEWLADNRGKGLLLLGGCGIGKSLFATMFLPWCFATVMDKFLNTYYAREITSPAISKMIKSKHLAVIDDVGTEHIANDYGTKYEEFSNVVADYYDKHGLLILTTNLSAAQIRERYGERTFDRLKEMCRVVVMQGESHRKSATYERA